MAFFGVFICSNCSKLLEQKKRQNETKKSRKKIYANKKIIKKQNLLHSRHNPFFRFFLEKVFLKI